MLTHVKDHLNGDLIPVRYIEPGTEVVGDLLASLEALARSVDAAEAEADAQYEGRLDYDYYSESFNFTRMADAEEALKFEALAITEAYQAAA